MKISQIFDKSYPPFLYLQLSNGNEYRIWANSSTDYGIILKAEYKYATSMKLGVAMLVSRIKKECDKQELKLIPQLAVVFQKLGVKADNARKKVLNWKTYDLWKEIENHKFLKSSNPGARAVEWYKKEVKVNPTLFFKANLLRQGFLYIFNYDTPKYKDILDFFDTQPLVISLGSVKTSLGFRDIGLNMHLLPPRIRRIVMYKVFELYRNLYKEQLFKKKQDIIMVKWKDLALPLFKYGIAFCIRMYIPELRKNVIEFPHEQWASAIYIPSKALSKITQVELEKKWREFVKEQNRKADGAKGLSESWIKS